ncbi:putative hyphothetical protein [Vibrio phage 424E50-1]|nr:putative hyphothetical protein [Vibrio phage 424E50-1]CAH9011757.1 putative hyphothetical protein [Vibrio phage 501E54-1]
MSDRNFLQRIQKAIQSTLEGGSKSEQPEEAVNTVIKQLNVEEQKAVEIVYKPDEKDAHGEWMSAETIAKGRESYHNNVVVPNLFHLVETDRFEITKSWLLEEDTDFEVDGETKTLLKGTWLAETHYTDTALWELKKSKELGGLSLGGYGDRCSETGEITNLCFSAEEYLQIHKEDEE